MFTPFSFIQPSELLALSVDYLIVGGGGAGGNNYAGGGGAGGLRSGSFTFEPYTSASVFVGGSGGSRGGTSTGYNGYYSSFITGSTTLSVEGGGGGAYTSYFTPNNAENGGSGGGGGAARQTTTNYGTGSIYGNRGGNGGTQATNGTPGGGGGASANGEDGVNSASGKAGDGGAGAQWLDGLYYAGGGAGQNYLGTTQAQGGIGGGGDGTCSSCTPAVVSTEGYPYTGGGGGAGARRGGSGVIKLRYAGDPVLEGGIVSQSAGYTYHEFHSIDEVFYGVTPNDAGWDPSDFSNIQYWWRGDLGVTETGTGVSVWEDQINGFQMVQGTDANRPSSTTDASLNNQQVIACNGTTDFMYTTTTPASRTGDFTFLVVYNIIDTRTGGMIFTPASSTTGSPGRIYFDTLNGTRRTFEHGFGTTAGSGVNLRFNGGLSVTGVGTAMINYNSSGVLNASADGINYGPAGNTGNANQGWLAGSTTCIGATMVSNAGSVFSGRYAEVNVAEAIVIYGTPTEEELRKFVRYAKQRYDIDI